MFFTADHLLLFKMAAQEEDEVDIEGIEDDEKTIDYKDIIENNQENHL